MGYIDVAASFETLKDRTFRYKVYLNESCAVELDEEPIHPINKDALKIALQIAIMVNSDIPEEIEVMRKTVLDGSNTSGFQRTALVGMNGWIETSFGKVGITNICLEEDAAQILKRDKKCVTYGLNRLGIPLVEIGTSPDIHEPEQAREVAEKIGMILRSTGKVKRGIGTIREDLNISIKGGARCEIKGVQKLNLIPKIVELETKRQLALIKKRKRVSKDVRKALPNGKTEFMRPMPGASRLYPETDCPPIQITKEKIERIKKSIPELIIEKQERLIEEHDLNEEVAKHIIQSERYKLFAKIFKCDKKLAIIFLTSPEAKKISDSRIIELFEAIKGNQIPKEAFFDIVKQIINNPENIKAIIKKVLKKAISDDDIRAEVKKIIKQKKGLSFGAYMGLVMKVFRGRADGKTIARILKEELKD